MRFRLPKSKQMPSAKDATAPSLSGVQVLIPAALNRPTHTLYSICVAVQPTLQEWTVNRRYSQFLQLRGDIINALSACRTNCANCASFCLAVRKFAFPRKTWIRTNRIVRSRVKSLQLFVQLIVEKLFNDLPKCPICGDQLKQMVRPFLIRGAQPMGDSTVPKIQHSLSLVSYAVVKHKPRNHRDGDNHQTHRNLRKNVNNQKTHDITDSNASTGSNSNSDSNSSSSSGQSLFSSSGDRQDSDPQMSPWPATRSTTTTATTTQQDQADEDDKYGKQYDDDGRCTDTAVPLKEALKQVVLMDKRNSTIEEVAFRLSSMWDAYDLEETLAAAPALSLTQEDDEETGDEADDDFHSQVQQQHHQQQQEDEEEEEEVDHEDDVDLLEGDDDDTDEDDVNNVSLALLQADYEYGEDDDLDRNGGSFADNEVTL